MEREGQFQLENGAGSECKVSGKRGQWEESTGRWVGGSERGQLEEPPGSGTAFWRRRGSVGGARQCAEGASSDEGWPVRRWVSGR